MIYRLCVPATIEDTDAVRVLEWHGSVGTEFPDGALIVELETHKALIEVRAAQLGILRRIDCAEGDWAPLGSSLALLGDTIDQPLPTDDLPIPSLVADFMIG